jgi:phosphopantetheine--protein transferase-like protein
MNGLRLGTDVVSVDRIRRISERDEAIFLQRVFGEQERRHLVGLAPGWPRWVGCAQHIAAKESVFKALETGLRGSMKWTDVQVVYTDGVPRLLVTGETQRLFESNRICDSWLSLGRTRELVIALVILITEGGVEAPSPALPLHEGECWVGEKETTS